MWRKAVIQGIKADPAWHGGNYESEPTMGLRVAESLLQVVGAAPLYLQKQYGTREKADAYVTQRIENGLKGLDANDMIYQFDSSRNYDPSDCLEKITTPTRWNNTRDDDINPWNSGLAEKAE